MSRVRDVDQARYIDDRMTTHLTRINVNPVVIQRLRGWAEEEDMTLGELVRYILSDYAPGQVEVSSDE